MLLERITMNLSSTLYRLDGSCILLRFGSCRNSCRLGILIHRSFRISLDLEAYLLLAIGFRKISIIDSLFQDQYLAI